MKSFGWVIGAGTVLAIGLASISLALTRRMEWAETPRDPEPLALAAEDLQVELDRLHSRYVDQLDDLAAEMWRSRGNTFGPERTAAKIVGVRSVSVLPLSEGQERIHLEVREHSFGELPFDEERFPPLFFSESEKEGVRILDRSEIEQSDAESGWLRSSSDVFYFWKKIGASGVMVAGVDGKSLQWTISAWLAEREEMAFHRMQSGAGESTRLVGPNGDVVAASGIEPESRRAPRIFPATIRFGTWQMQAWSAAEKQVRWNLPYLLAGLGLSVLVFAGSIAAAFALRRATRLARQRVSFVNRASHELRTPITNMMLNVDLARELVEESPDAANDRLDRVSDEASRLSRLVDNLLTFSRSENGTDHLRRIRLDPVESLEEVLRQFEMSLQHRKLDVVWESKESAEIQADPDALAQVFGNLISNVEKYAAGGGLLEIDTELRDQKWQVEFRDRGPGISARQAARIFDPFHRASDQVNEGVSGTGLGLTIARDLARRMEGELELVPADEGATFRVTLPLSSE